MGERVRENVEKQDFDTNRFGPVLGRVYDFITGLFTLNMISSSRQKAIDALELQEGQTVIDFACGTGGLSIIAAKKVGEEGKVIGIDKSQDMLDRAISKSRGIAQLDYIQHDFCTLPVTTPYDAAMAGLAAHEVSARARLGLYQKAYDSLRPGGKFLILDYVTPKKNLGGIILKLFLRLTEPHGMEYIAEDHLKLLAGIGFTRIFDKAGGVLETAIYQKPE
jgi:ubiquinone/menaquinone biosynthesis C-methylase UbiE